MFLLMGREGGGGGLDMEKEFLNLSSKEYMQWLKKTSWSYGTSSLLCFCLAINVKKTFKQIFK